MKLPFSNAFWVIVLFLLFYAVFAIGVPRYMESESYQNAELKAVREAGEEMLAETRKAESTANNRILEEILVRAAGTYELKGFGLDYQSSDTPKVTVQEGKLIIHKNGKAQWSLLLTEPTGGEIHAYFQSDIKMIRRDVMEVHPELDPIGGGIRVIRPMKESVDAIRNHFSNYLRVFISKETVPTVSFGITALRLDWKRSGESDPAMPRLLYEANKDWWVSLGDCTHVGHLGDPKQYVDKYVNGNACRIEEQTIFDEKVLVFHCVNSSAPIHMANDRLRCLAARFGTNNIFSTVTSWQNASADIDQLLKMGADINMVDERGETALSIAMNPRIDVAITRQLLQNGADPNAGAPLGKLFRFMVHSFSTPNASEGQIEKARLLLEAGADPDQKVVWDLSQYRFRGVQGIFHALTGKNYDNLQLPAFAAVAARQGDPKLMHMLLEHGADVNEPEKNTGMTPLMFAMIFPYYSDPELPVKLLLERKADPLKKSLQGENAVSLLQKGGMSKPLHIRQLVAAGAALPVTDLQKMAPIARALIDAGDAGTLTMLLKQGMSPDIIVNKSRETLLYYAIGRKNASIARLLIGHKADIDMPVNGVTTLIYAIQQDMDAALVGELALRTSAINAVARNERLPRYTALDFAVEKHAVAVADMLRKQGAKPALLLRLPDQTLAENPEAAKVHVEKLIQAIASGRCGELDYQFEFPVWEKGRYLFRDEWMGECRKSLELYRTLSVGNIYYPKDSRRLMKYDLYENIKGLDLAKTIMVDVVSEAKGGQRAQTRSFVLSCSKFKCTTVAIDHESLKDR